MARRSPGDGQLGLPGIGDDIPLGEVKADASKAVNIKNLDTFQKQVESLNRSVNGLDNSLRHLSKTGDGVSGTFDKAGKSVGGAARSMGASSEGGGSSTWGGDNGPKIAGLVSSFGPGSGGGPGGGGPGGGGPPVNPNTPVPPSGGGGGIMDSIPVLGTIKRAAEIAGAVAQTGAQYGWNRIEGESGNRAAMLQASQALGPQATVTGLHIQSLITGLAQRTPVQGSFSDVLSTVLAGQSVGANLKGTDKRNGFFEGVRQMQVMTPGISAGQLSGSLASYMGNTRSQQMGTFLGQGAFTMMGQGGKYKSVAEWATGITKFFEQQRPGPERGKPFSKDELIAQNFPGSNINAWFQMMGVPGDMVEYWWQYVLTKAGAGGKSLETWNKLGKEIGKQRGTDIGYERVRNVTQATRRDFVLGNQMFPLYAAREGADRRFNVAMEQSDLMLGAASRNTNLGAMIATMPTAISEFLMPLFMKFMGTPAGVGAGLVGGLLGDPEGPIGDPTPIGDYGNHGGRSTFGLSPDLGKRVSAMMRDNPNVKVSSGYRDSYLNDKLNKKGVGRVAPSSKSKHTRGWAADLGPTSQLGWIAQNAHKYGLQTAHNQGEPWHVQLAGTMPVGDPMPIGDIWDTIKGGASSSIFGAIGGNAIGGGIEGAVNALKVIMESLTSVGFGGGGLDLVQKTLGNFIKGGDYSSMMDNIINLYGQLMMSPTIGLMDLFGKYTGPQDFENLINKQSVIKIDLPKFDGFKPEDLRNHGLKPGHDVFGDPPIGDAGFGRAGGMTLAPTQIVYKNTFNIDANGLSTPQDARRAAAAIADHLETELQSQAHRRL